MAEFEILTSVSGEPLWERILDKINAAHRRRPWDPPLWILPDKRHATAAVRDLLRLSPTKAVATGSFHNLLSWAAQILDLPHPETVADPDTAVLCLEELTAEDLPDAYRSSAAAPGFTRAFWSAVEDVESQGFFPDEVLSGCTCQPPPPFVSLQRRLHRALHERGFYTAADILRRACRKLKDGIPQPKMPETVFLGPFFNPSVIEREFIRIIAHKARHAVLIPAPGSVWAKDFDRKVGETRVVPPAVRTALVRPRTPEEELDAVFTHIALSVLDGSHNYRDFRIICPFPAEVSARLESTARIFHVPIRGGGSLPLSSFPPAQQVLRLLDLFQNRWRRQNVLDLLRSPSISAPFDQVHAAISEVLKRPSAPEGDPSRYWLEVLSHDLVPEVAAQLERLAELDRESGNLNGGTDFSLWLEACLDFIRRDDDAGEDDFEPGSEAVERERGWEALEKLGRVFRFHFRGIRERDRLFDAYRKAIRARSYQRDDAVGDAVEICPSSREDHLPVPVVIYLGMDSKIPAQPRLSPFHPEEVKSDYDERFRIFKLQLNNAREFVLLSCPEYDDEGTEVAQSPFLHQLFNEMETPFENMRIDPLSREQLSCFGTDLPKKRRAIDKLRRAADFPFLIWKSRRWRVTELDSIIQCPYQHFVRFILRLEPPEDRVEEGVTPGLLGWLAHDALREFFAKKKQGKEVDIEGWVRREFARRTAVLDPHPEAYSRLEELVLCLKKFITAAGDGLIAGYSPVEFEYELKDPAGGKSWRLEFPDGSVFLSGRIDRYDEDTVGRAVVLDYKYQKSDGNKGDTFLEEIREGLQPQLPLYAYYLQEVQGKAISGILEIFLRSGDIFGFKAPESGDFPDGMSKEKNLVPLTPETRAELFDRALLTLKTFSRKVAEGSIEAAPRNTDYCGPGRCDYADLCRYRQRRKRRSAS